MDSDFLKGLATVFPDDETQSPTTVYFQPPQKKNYPLKWFTIWQDESEIGVSMTEQAKSCKMTLSDYRVRDFLMGTIGLGNYVYVNQSEVARELKLHKVTVCESIKRLCEFNILVKGPKSGRSCTYMVSPAFCFAGNLGHGVKERKATILQFKPKEKQQEWEQGKLPF